VLASIDILIPDVKILNLFENKVFAMYEQINHNTQEIKTLTQLRDTLLPKLMSGEMDVNQVETEKEYEQAFG
jgi:type I restriction enzyme S subunit